MSMMNFCSLTANTVLQDATNITDVTHVHETVSDMNLVWISHSSVKPTAHNE